MGKIEKVVIEIENMIIENKKLIQKTLKRAKRAFNEEDWYELSKCCWEIIAYANRIQGENLSLIQIKEKMKG